jgi:hypothetical protein
VLSTNQKGAIAETAITAAAVRLGIPVLRPVSDGARYSADEIDLLAAYCAEIDRCYALPSALVDNRQGFYLRLEATRNNQAQGILWATDFELGAIAQLGERRDGIAKVVGSSPTSSTP